MASLEYAANEIFGAILDVSSKGAASALDAFVDVSDELAANGSVYFPESQSHTVIRSAANGQTVSAATMSGSQIVADQPIGYMEYLTRQQLDTGLRGRMLDELAKSLYGSLQDAIASAIIDAGRDAMIGSAATNHVVNSGASTLTQTHVNRAEALARAQGGVNSMTEMSWILGSGVEAAAKGLANYFAPGNEAGVGQVDRLNGHNVYVTNALESVLGSGSGTSAVGKQVACSAGTVSGSGTVLTLTVPQNHGFVAGQKVYLSGTSADALATSAAPATIASTTATTLVLTVSGGSDGALADGVGVVYNASAFGVLAIKPWCWYGLSQSGINVAVVEATDGLNKIVKVDALFGAKFRVGSFVAVHAPII